MKEALEKSEPKGEIRPGLGGSPASQEESDLRVLTDPGEILTRADEMLRNVWRLARESEGGLVETTNIHFRQKVDIRELLGRRDLALVLACRAGTCDSFASEPLLVILQSALKYESWGENDSTRQLEMLITWEKGFSAIKRFKSIRDRASARRTTWEEARLLLSEVRNLEQCSEKRRERAELALDAEERNLLLKAIEVSSEKRRRLLAQIRENVRRAGEIEIPFGEALPAMIPVVPNIDSANLRFALEHSHFPKHFVGSSKHDELLVWTFEERKEFREAGIAKMRLPVDKLGAVPMEFSTAGGSRRPTEPWLRIGRGLDLTGIPTPQEWLSILDRAYGVKTSTKDEEILQMWFIPRIDLP